MHRRCQHADPPTRRGVYHPEAHHPHADRALPGAADGEGVVDDRRGGEDREQAPAEPERQQADECYEDAEAEAEQRDHHEVDQIGKEPAAERAFCLADRDHGVGTRGQPLWGAIRSVRAGEFTSHVRPLDRVSNFPIAPRGPDWSRFSLRPWKRLDLASMAARPSPAAQMTWAPRTPSPGCRCEPQTLVRHSEDPGSGYRAEDQSVGRFGPILQFNVP